MTTDSYEEKARELSTRLYGEPNKSGEAIIEPALREAAARELEEMAALIEPIYASNACALRQRAAELREHQTPTKED